ncbi:NAD(P)/FAD-dependent oxidoreductase [Pseudonocardia broussonetiae]|uniref:FAD-binding protein n=1 Tax=Pseudonocardia broussonetiae TaxID=2736640 RepID=A0A6M6JR28_9PSEU|nr:FAD-dependent monooxygenase [Pseudonocardia broussonetiae]QJY49447.1 FAD-binding protein [Pseudonocardia broussonetiae]
MTHAVVLGASMAGLLAARVLSESFDHVTVVERDTLPTGAADRRGVPQGRHPHVLLPRGREVLEELLPGLTDALVARGAVTGTSGQIRFLLAGHRFLPVPGTTRTLMLSRALLESHVRQEVRGLVDVRERRDVVGLLGDRTRVTGVQVRDRDTAQEQVLDADLVVDATGRASRTPVWLAERGGTAPREDRVTVDVGYTTGRFRLRPGALGDQQAVLLSAAPGVPRGGAVFPVEGGEHLVVLIGGFDDRPPADPEGYHRFAATLPFPDVADALVGAEPVGPLRVTRFPANAWRRYDLLDDLPAGLLVLGDAVCSFNPVYGQGMTVAALQALALRGLTGAPDPRAHARAVARVVRPVWDLTVGADLQDPRVDGPRTRAGRLVGAYIGRVQAAAAVDPAVAKAFVQVTGLLAPPPSLMRPDRVARVAWASLRSSRRFPAPRTSELTGAG